MRRMLTLAIVFISIAAFGQSNNDSVKQLDPDKWNEEAKTNIKLLPKYGLVKKNEKQKKMDQEFIAAALKLDTTNRKASHHMILLGFSYLYRDIKIAMYRFNQAYLLDSTNIDIYWGFGAVYMVLGEFEKAEKQYLQGLSRDSNNTHLLTDYATFFMTQYSILSEIDPDDQPGNLKSAITYLSKSYQLDSNNPNTTYKLSTCYFYMKDCDNAWKFYRECKALGGQPITEKYTNTLMEECKQKK